MSSGVSPIAEHVRLVHFTVLASCAALVLVLSGNGDIEQRAKQELQWLNTRLALAVDAAVRHQIIPPPRFIFQESKRLEVLVRGKPLVVKLAELPTAWLLAGGGRIST